MDLILTHNKFDNENVPLFDSKRDLFDYFYNNEDKVIIEDVNFNAGDLINTTQVVQINETLSLLKILNYNYCLVSNGTIAETLYYKINKSSQENGPFVKLELELDVWNTYGLDLLDSHPQAMIKRAMLNRFDFSQRQGNYAPFDYKKDSPLFEREIIKNVALRTTDRTKLKFIIDTSEEEYNDSTFNDFIFDNVICWKYYFLSENVSYKYKDLDGTQHTQELVSMAYWNDELSIGNSNFVVLCAPIYKNTTSKRIYINPNNQTSKMWNDNAIYNLIVDQQGKWANVKAVKYSFVPPLDIRDMFNRYNIDANGNMILTHNVNTTLFYMPDIATNSCFGLRQFQKINEKILLKSKTFKPKMKSKIGIPLKENEPKLFNEDYATYKLYVGGQQMELPVSKTSFAPKFYYHEILTPEITKAMISYATTQEDIFGNTNKNVFSEETETDFTGFSMSVDLGVWIPENQLDSFLVSNKNYFQINANNAATKGVTSFLGALGGIFNSTQTKEPNILAGVANSSLGLATTGISMINEGVNRELTLDNMRNNPNSVANLNSDPLLMISVGGGDFGIYIELQEALEHEQEMIVDYFLKFGYAYNRLGLLEDFVHTRIYYNYIEADINDIDLPISVEAKRRLTSLFSNGLRLWHDKNYIDYHILGNNYETEWDNL